VFGRRFAMSNELDRISPGSLFIELVEIGFNGNLGRIYGEIWWEL